MVSAVALDNVAHRFGQREALRGVSFQIERGELFGVLGPNGGGKTTLFRLLATLLPLQSGEAQVLGFDLRREPAAIRSRLGVVFQSPSVDRQLTVAENIATQAALYGLWGAETAQRAEDLLARLGLADRAHDLVETLSGGLRRRVELAKGLIHRPPLLLLDEPTVALDPGARADFWNWLDRLRAAEGTTIVFTTHLLEEAEKADRLAILDAGRVVALDTPSALRDSVGGLALVVRGPEPEILAGDITRHLALPARVIDGEVWLDTPDAPRQIPRLVEALPGRVDSIRLGRPTLEDVFVARTGHRFVDCAEELADA